MLITETALTVTTAALPARRSSIRAWELLDVVVRTLRVPVPVRPQPVGRNFRPCPIVASPTRTAQCSARVFRAEPTGSPPPGTALPTLLQQTAVRPSRSLRRAASVMNRLSVRAHPLVHYPHQCLGPLGPLPHVSAAAICRTESPPSHRGGSSYWPNWMQRHPCHLRPPAPGLSLARPGRTTCERARRRRCADARRRRASRIR